MEPKRREHDPINFDAVTLRLASPERILDWSYGEVTKPETINYRTQRAEKNGLFDEKIFGPEKDYECYCGKYRGIRYKGIVCDKCGVEVTRSIVRRERMAHIELAIPVAHIWFLRGIPSRIALILGLSASDVEKVAYFAGYIITKVDETERASLLKELDSEYKNKVGASKDAKTKTKLKELLTATKQDIQSIQEMAVVDEATYHKFAVKYGGLFEAEIGAEAVYNIFKNINLDKLIKKLNERLEVAGAVEREKLNKRLALLKSMRKAGVRPEWMFLVRLPVIPPALRPMVPLEGGRHASSDVNDLYRRVINRNNRLKKLQDINAPEVIQRNEKRILQEAVDALIDNSIRHGNTMFSAMSQSQRRPLKSLSDYLKGKQGYFRGNLLGKRVDYSGRSVIVIGPDLEIDQCGLPKHMALELFRPFVISKLLEKELAYNIRGAGRLIEDGIPEVWAILEDVIKDKHVLLNRAPTLHRQGIQAFRPILIEGNAIQIHPLVCEAFNADFDGDQMAVHVPLSDEAQLEAKEIMSARENVLKPGSGEVVTNARQDIILGCYWMTKIVEGEKGEGKFFPSPNNAITAYDFEDVGFRSKIKVMPTTSDKYKDFNGEVFETSVGRLLFNSVLPKDFPFINDEMTNKKMAGLVEVLIDKYGLEEIPYILDKIKNFGFKYATHAGVTWSLSDVTVPPGKEGIVDEAKKEAAEIIAQYNEGLLSANEKVRMLVKVWQDVTTNIEKLLPDTLDPNGSVHDMLFSGARGSVRQLNQMAGMKGLIQNTKGEVIDFPIIASMKEGLTPIEYFVTTHGARKGLSDTALQTAKAGYLTRRLFDVAQDIIITENDCSTKEGVEISRDSASGIKISFARNLRGRILSEAVKSGRKTLFEKGHMLSAADAEVIEADEGVEAVILRSPMTCRTPHGICKKCYGADISTNELVEIGEAIGTVAAQAIGEPGTQLTMRTFHTGGTASVGGDITQGLPRVEEVFERRQPKNPAAIAHISGTVSEIRDEGKEKILVLLPDGTSKTTKKKDLEYPIHFLRMLLVKVGDKVEKGQFLTDGSANLEEHFKFAGKEATQEYIISETSRIYELQGVTISRKHIEVIIRQMFSRRKIKQSGDTEFSVGDMVEEFDLLAENKRVKGEGGEQAVADALLLGIMEVSLSRKSFLSASSFQNTTRVLINAAVKGGVDKLRGLKENVIIGRLIPAGTGYEGSPKNEKVAELKRELSQKDAEMRGEEE
ncbi:MAG: DNA-directed RNA polymerase subunit beta' [Candidatus Pacebacteria bacterium]|jgi:DNA-directed RNA polymerase subunit beta'|nr:DNA-directed RNA polymerase subunit beta' [Candidatus Paceibacterota bacterium]MDP6659642.1 DNA-directed RNA polymerase subunit beta' [Candidatus Paceibacterota bacterium]